MGYSSNRVLLELVENIRAHSVPVGDRRGQGINPNKKDEHVIREHFEPCHPVSSHNRRQHAQNRRYVTNETYTATPL